MEIHKMHFLLDLAVRRHNHAGTGAATTAFAAVLATLVATVACRTVGMSRLSHRIYRTYAIFTHPC